MRRDLAASLLLAGLACGAPFLAERLARPVLLNLGPNDTEYLGGFRSEWERDKLTRFHWTGQAASITLPVRLQGAGHVLKMRIRRHFVEPALVNLRVEEQTVASFSIQADPTVAYRVVEIPLPELRGTAPFSVFIRVVPTVPQPLGIAIDWLEIERRGPGARIGLLDATRIRGVVAVLVAFLAVRCAGGRRLALLVGWTLGIMLGAGVVLDVLAAERILREGLAPFTLVVAASALLVRWPLTSRALGVRATPWGPTLVALAAVAAVVRLVMVLHPQFYYPDVKVHSLFAWQLARKGLWTFLQEFTANQFRYSLGLQFESGHWYAFPYPPAFYVLCWPLVRLAGYRPEVAVSLVAAVVNAMEGLVVFGIARHLKLSARHSLAAAAAHPLLPIFLARLSLAYFPALVGHFVDALTLAYLASRLGRLHRPRVMLCGGALLALALLTYTQGLLNFAVFLGLFLALDVMFDPTPDGRRQQVGLMVVGALGVALSFTLFYGRYLPTFVQMQRGIPMAEEQILLEKFEAAARVRTTEGEPAPDDDDPFDGPNVDPARGFRKAAWRLYVFYGPFSVAVVLGLFVVARRVGGRREARFVLAWAATYVCLNLASGGLPGPNLVRYNKDLEIVAPLFCLCLGALAVWLSERTRLLAAIFATSFWVFGAARAARYLTERFVLER